MGCEGCLCFNGRKLCRLFTIRELTREEIKMGCAYKAEFPIFSFSFKPTETEIIQELQ